MYERTCLVIDKDMHYKTIVNVDSHFDTTTGHKVDRVYSYELKDGEFLVDCVNGITFPTARQNAGTEGFVIPCWDSTSKKWVEGATPEKIAAWEAENPAPEPTPMPPTTDELAAENKLLRAQVDALTGQADFQEELIVEMANIVYA